MLTDLAQTTYADLLEHLRRDLQLDAALDIQHGTLMQALCPGTTLTELIDAAGASPFVQLQGTAARRAFSFGLATLTWPAAVLRSNTNNVAHNLGRVPVWAGATQVVPGAALFDAYPILDGVPDATNVKLAAESTTGAPGAGATQQVFWAVLG